MEFDEAFVLLFIERMREKNSTSWEDRQFHKIESGLTELETIIPESGFCIGAFFTIADIAIVATVQYLSMRFEELRIQEKFLRLASFLFHGDNPLKIDSHSTTTKCKCCLRNTVRI